jgi:hypothetical protein
MELEYHVNIKGNSRDSNNFKLRAVTKILQDTCVKVK